jgi:hypothetical protein
VDRQCTNDGDQHKLRCTSTVLLHQEPDSNSGRVDKVSSVHILFDFASIRQKGPYESKFSGFAVGYPARSSNLVIDACVPRLTIRPPKKEVMDPENLPHRGSPKPEDERTSSDNEQKMPGGLPADLPTSLDDRRTMPEYAGETEMYDGWQGSRILACYYTPRRPEFRTSRSSSREAILSPKTSSLTAAVHI